MQRYMLDTNHVSYIVNGRSAAARYRMSQLRSNESACISSITQGELLDGIAKKPNEEKLRDALLSFMKRTEVLPWGSAEATVYGELRAVQESLGKRIEPMDMLIAAHAIATGAVLVTRDKAFRHVLRLAELENWATDLA